MGSKARCRKRGIDGAERPVALGRHAGGKDDRVLFGDADIEVARGMMRPVEIERGAVGHRSRDGDDLLVIVGERHQRLGEDLGVGALADRLGVAGLRIVRPEAVKLLYLLQRRLETAALLRQDVQQHRHLLALEKLECADQQLDVVAVERTVVVKPELLEEHGGPQQALRCLLGLAYNFRGSFAAEALDQTAGARVQVVVVLVGHHLVKIAGNSADITVDGPLVVVEDNDQALGLLADVVQRLKRNAVGEGGVPGHGDNVLAGAGEVARDRHAQRGGERRARVARSVGVVLGLGAQHEAVQAARLPDGVEALGAAGQQLVHVGLVADVEEELVRRRVEDVMHRQRQLDNAQVRPQVAAGLGEAADQQLTNLLRKLGELCDRHALDVRRRLNGTEMFAHRGNHVFGRRSQENDPAKTRGPARRQLAQVYQSAAIVRAIPDWRGEVFSTVG